MLKIFALVLSLGFGFQSFSQTYYQKDLNNWNWLNVRGGVKKISETTSGGRYSGNSKIWEFNKMGGVLLCQSLNEDGDIQKYGSYQISYDEFGLPVQKQIKGKTIYFSFNADGCIERIINTYDYYLFECIDETKHSSVKVYAADSTLKSHIKFIYNVDGKIIRQDKYKDGKLHSSTEYVYDEFGNNIEIKSQVSGNAICLYDDFGNKTQKEEYRADGTLIKSLSYKYRYQYDDYGNWVKRERIENDEVTITYTRVYEYF